MRLKAAALALLVVLPLNYCTVEQQYDNVRCEQWGGRFADPCRT